MSRLLLTELEEFEAVYGAPENSKNSSILIYPQSVPTLNHAQNSDSRSVSENQLTNDKLWVHFYFFEVLIKELEKSRDTSSFKESKKSSNIGSK